MKILVPIKRVIDYQFFRIGDAVACRDIHAAMYHAMRVCKDL